MKHLHFTIVRIVSDKVSQVLEVIKDLEINGFTALDDIKKKGIWLNPQNFVEHEVEKDRAKNKKVLFEEVSGIISLRNEEKIVKGRC